MRHIEASVDFIENFGRSSLLFSLYRDSITDRALYLKQQNELQEREVMKVSLWRYRWKPASFNLNKSGIF